MTGTDFMMDGDNSNVSWMTKWRSGGDESKTVRNPNMSLKVIERLTKKCL